MSKTDNNNLTVYKSNALVEAAYRLSVMEQRLVLAAITQLQHNEPVTDEVMYSVSVDDIARLCGTESKSTYEEIQEAALRLKRREVRIIKNANGNGHRKRVLVTGWVQAVEYVEGEGTVQLCFSKHILPYLTQLTQQFTKYRLEHVSRMSSSYAIRLYELLVQWKESGEREIAIDWLRKVFELGNQYKPISNLKARVIDPAVSQINEHSDLHVTWTQKKSGRIVTHLIFKFKPKKAAKPKAPQPKRVNLSEGSEYGVPKKLLESIAYRGETYKQAADRIKKHVREGESYEQAAERIRREGIL